ncbi:hypothetical protein [Clostridium kluyveri]|uniref:Uncharacterized protein n=1 Tax=Clostridium kluyveri TaxID=1534 RepID=A0A1L5F4A9_CLOKL|nr:hypothetical protein [Clostridium kluyveri]APM37807.1 hypothetical protein BS101_03130 [Clostridium kluyveri]
MGIDKMLKEIRGAMNIAQQIVLSGETMEFMDVTFDGQYIILIIQDGKEFFNYKYKVDDKNLISNLLIEGLINEIYQKDLLPRKYQIKKIKKHLDRQLERIFNWKSKIAMMKKQKIYDFELERKVARKLNEINEEIYINWKAMDDIKVDLYEYEIFKDILFESLKELP